MDYRRVGSTDIECSVLGLGTGKLASLSTGIPAADALRLIEVAAHCGINFIDTADSYGQGESEKIIGRAVRGKRDKFVIATKAGYRFSRIASWMGFAKPLVKRVLQTVRGSRRIAGEIRSGAPKMKLLSQDFSAGSVKAALEGSLRRLQTDYVDLFFLHDVPLTVLGDDALFSTLDQLKRAGKIRQFGVSSNNVAVLECALKRAGISVAQTAVNPGRPYDLWGALAKLQQAGVGVVANQVFNSGKLLATKDAALQERLSRLQHEKQMTGTQILLQFAAAQPAVFSVLTGTMNPEHLKQNAAEISSASKLTAEEISFLRGDSATF